MAIRFNQNNTNTNSVNKDAVLQYRRMVLTENGGYSANSVKQLCKDIVNGRCVVLSEGLRKAGIRAGQWDTTSPIVSYYAGDPNDQDNLVCELDFARIFRVGSQGQQTQNRGFNVPQQSQQGQQKKSKSKKDDDFDPDDLKQMLKASGMSGKMAKVIAGMAALISGADDSDEEKSKKADKKMSAKERRSLKRELIGMLESCNDFSKVHIIGDLKVPHRPYAAGELWRVTKDEFTETVKFVAASDKTKVVELDISDIMNEALN